MNINKIGFALAFGLVASAIAGPTGTVRYQAYYDEAKDVTVNHVNRAYLGYSADLAEDVSGKVVYDVQSVNDDGNADGKPRYGAYAKNALFTVKQMLPMTDVTFGLQTTLNFVQPYKFWGHGYIANPVAIDNKLASSADVGISTTSKVNEQVKIQLGVFSGDGYKNTKGSFENPEFAANFEYDQGDLKLSTFQAVRKFENSDLELQSVHTFNAMYDAKSVRFGAEAALKVNSEGSKVDGSQQQAYALFGAAPMNEKVEVIARGETYMTKVKDSGKFYGLAGVTYSPIKKAKLTLLGKYILFENSDIDPTYQAGLWSEVSF